MFAGALPEKTHALLKKIFYSIGDQGFYLAGGSGLALQMGHSPNSKGISFHSRYTRRLPGQGRPAGRPYK